MRQTGIFGWAVGIALGIALSGCAAARSGNGSDQANSSSSTGGAATGGMASSTGGGNAGGNGAANAGASAAGASSHVPGTPGCGLDAAAFCDTFDVPSPGGRAGDLDDELWSVSRAVGTPNPSQGEFGVVPQGTAERCGQTVEGIFPPNDIAQCTDSKGNGVMALTLTDAGGWYYTSMRPRQPFDFAGRTGKIVFDVDGRQSTPEGHGFWFEVWMSDESLPGPYQGGPGIYPFPKNGLGLNFSDPCGTVDETSNGIQQITVIKDYQVVHDYGWADLQTAAKTNQCFKTAPGVLNHFEIDISSSELDVSVSDAGDPGSFRKVFALPNPDLSFTRAYVNFQQSHYNAAKGGLTPWHTISWDNIGFDGPVLPFPPTSEHVDALLPTSHTYTFDVGGQLGAPYVISDVPALNIAYAFSTAGGMRTCCDKGNPIAVPSLEFDGVSLGNARAATFSAMVAYYGPSSNVEMRWNGGSWRSVAYPFPDADDRRRTVAWPVDVGDLVAGKNSLELRATNELTIDNMDLQITPQ